MVELQPTILLPPPLVWMLLALLIVLPLVLRSTDAVVRC
jgi:hypothetical protein